MLRGFYLLFLLMPTLCMGLIQSDLSKVIDVAPGKEYLCTFSLVNTYDEPLRIRLQQSDYKYQASGENFYLPPGSIEQSNANWIELPKTFLELPPHSEMEVGYTVRVPSKLDKHGSYWSLIFVEPELGQKLEDANSMIEVRIRYAYQVVTNHGQGKPQLKLQATSLATIDGQRYVNLDVENPGNIFLRPKLEVKIYDAAGKIVSSVESIQQSILPGMSIRYPVAVTELPPQDYHGLLLLRDGDRYYGEKFRFSLL